ncbi:hypothetical protein ACIBEJ_32585 [Nonomuraea sp. NPDC050790]|uniref:hypothetical protein n=1 Tax=Nonomuraea sp. NPDC050790 TaxID=3364371 RepID=UPI00379FB610
MISMKMTATQWLTSARRDSVKLADGPAKFRQEQSVFGQESAFHARARHGAGFEAVLVYGAGVAPSAPAIAGAPSIVPNPQNTKGGLCGPQPWRDAPVIT